MTIGDKFTGEKLVIAGEHDILRGPKEEIAALKRIIDMLSDPEAEMSIDDLAEEVELKTKLNIQSGGLTDWQKKLAELEAELAAQAVEL